jgi:hypothetical protein
MTTTMMQLKNKINSRYNASNNYNTIWICYRCNLTFHDGAIVSLHDEISQHYARKVESFQTKQGGESNAR